ncbi:hypothetical protein H0H93_015319 [Arthromyces matolae]|nr:hypothetical protein H0H93_015319 [Arthromyces matolae]
MSGSAEYVQSGFTYTITNAKAGTVVDLSGEDNRSRWTFQSVGSGLYIAIDGSSADGTRLVAQTTPFGWDIWHDATNPETYRIFIHNTTYNWDLYHNGDSAPKTPITLWYQWAGVHQTWKFTRV